jgi:16S rRNA C967 or C1407 C5-methylase (RsmB/RsmF family)
LTSFTSCRFLFSFLFVLIVLSFFAMQRTRRAFFDSFKAARGELDSLFSSLKSEEHMRKEVRRYIVPAFSHRRHRYLNERLSPAQQRSFFRSSVSLLLQEARRRGSYRVAAAALDVALTEARLSHLAEEFDPAWVKDAVASCQSVEELRAMEAVLRGHERQLLHRGAAGGTEGFLLTAAFGRSAAATTERGRRLGDEKVDMEEEEDGGEGALTDTEGESFSPAVSGPSALTISSAGDDVGSIRADRSCGLASLTAAGTPALSSSKEGCILSDERRVVAALTQPPSASDLAVHGGSGGDGGSLWSSPEARAAAGLRRLQRQRRDITAGPNVSFTRYFLHQGLVRSEGELMSLYQSMRSRPHDLAFRVVGGEGSSGGSAPHSHALSTAPYAAAVHDLLQRRRGIYRVPWLPPSMGAYTLDTRDSVPQDTVLSNRQLLRSLARERLIVYQSLSSMLPVLFLDPQPGESVLDLCASPGSKTGLILDAMHGMPATALASGGGCVVANEAQASRIRDLQERLRDVSPDVAVTRSCGQSFASTSPQESSSSGSRSSSSPALHSMLAEVADAGAFSCLHVEGGMYDAVLVDAPCSGEGRMGRDALSWRLWHPGRGLEFFPLQCALLQRAMQLCKTGGRVVYATCTLNPIENEAVVAAVLRAFNGAVELVPAPTHLLSRSAHAATRGGERSADDEEDGGAVPVMRLSPGLRRWDVPSSAGGFFRSPAEAYAQGESRSRLLPEMFAAESSGHRFEWKDGDDVGQALHRCCRRVMPHHNGNVDGFFVAVLRKTASTQRSLSTSSHAESPSAGGTALPGMSRVAASSSSSSLAASLAGGSNLLMDRGLVRLQASSHIVQKHLGPFFTPPLLSSPQSTAAQSPSLQGCSTVQGFLDRQGWTAMWCEGEGLRLLSKCAVELLHRHSTAASRGRTRKSSSSSPLSAAPITELIDAGVLVVDAHGALTERGAGLLRSGASSRVVTLPLPYAQLLLANRTLDVGGSLRLMPAFMQEAELAFNPRRGLLSSAGAATTATMAGEVAAPPWCLNAMTALRDATAGNAIVCIHVPSSASCDSPLTHHGGGGRLAPLASAADVVWAAPLTQWSWPVRVEILRPWSGAGSGDMSSGLARLHLTLSPASRHRVMALIGRLQGHAHRSRGAQVPLQRAQLQASADFSPSLMMGDRDLHGTALQASHQHRQLFHRGSGRPGEAHAAALGATPLDGKPSTASPSPSVPSSTVFEL